MRVAITGGSGLIGTALSHHLASGHEVVPLKRVNGKRRGHYWNPAEGWIAPDALEGCDALVHLAGASIGEGRWTASRKRVLRSSRIDATRLLVGHLGAMRQPPSVLVAVSAVGYYGERGDEVLTEDSARGAGFLAELCEDWEREARAADAHGIRVAAPRLGVVLAKDGGALPRMVLPMRLGAGGRLGSGRQWMPWVTLRDAVRALEFLLTHEVSGPFNVVAPDIARNAAFTKALGKQLHRPAVFPAPAFGLRLLLGQAADELLLASQRVTSERLETAGFAFEDERLEGALEHVFGEPARAEAAVVAVER